MMYDQDSVNPDLNGEKNVNLRKNISVLASIRDSGMALGVLYGIVAYYRHG